MLVAEVGSDITGKNILITGGAGFIGSTLAKRLVENNKITIYDSLSRNSIKTKGILGHKNIEMIQGDILDLEGVKRAAENADIFVHAAAIAGINATVADPVNTMKVNMIGTMNALDAAVSANKIERFIDFSTSEVFGSHAYQVEEGDRTVMGTVGEARWTYAVSKLAGEHLSHAYHRKHGLPVVLIRPFNVYGPGQVGEGAMQIFIRRALKDEDLFIFGDGTQIRAWCYIDDFIDSLCQCLSVKEAVGEVFNIGNSRAVITIYNMAHLICRVLNSKSKILFKDALSADIELRIPKVDKMKRVLGVEAKVDLDEGVKNFAAWIRDHDADLPELSSVFLK